MQGCYTSKSAVFFYKGLIRYNQTLIEKIQVSESRDNRFEND